MLVKDWMSKPAVTVAADASVAKAVKLLKRREINMLYIINHDERTRQLY